VLVFFALIPEDPLSDPAKKQVAAFLPSLHIDMFGMLWKNIVA
jgi:hypothetical protein